MALQSTNDLYINSLLQINPQHSVPTLDDNGDIIWDSHAICTYLVGKYGADDALYPKDLVQRARVDQRLHFDSGILYPASRAANVSIFNGGSEVPQDKIDGLYAAYELLEKFLQNDDYLVGNSLTVADLCCVATVTTMDVHAPIEQDQYPKIHGWIERLAELPFFEELNTKLVVGFRGIMAMKKKANRAAQ